MFDELTTYDRTKLEELRLQRFHQEAALGSAIAHLSLDYELQIICETPAQVDEFMERFEALESLAAIILGSDEISLVFAGERVWPSGEAMPVFPWEEGDDLECWEEHLDRNMVATAERPIAQVQEKQSASTTTGNLQPFATVAEVVAQTIGRSVDDVAKWILSMNPPLEPINGQIFIPAGFGVKVIDRWAEQAKRKLEGITEDASRSPVENRASAAGTNGAAVEVIESATQTEEASTPSGNLELPKGYTQNLSRKYETTLTNLLPEDQSDRAWYLQQITEETDAGRDWLIKVSGSIARKFKRSSDRAYDGLLQAAKAMTVT